MAIFDDNDTRCILEATGKIPDPAQCGSAREGFDQIASSYLEHRFLATETAAAFRVADKLSKIASTARSLQGTVSYGDQAVNEGVRRALTRAALRAGHPADDVLTVLAGVARLETWASTAHREVREGSKWPGRLQQEPNEAVESLLEGLLGVWLRLFETAPRAALDSPFLKLVGAYVQRLAPKVPDTAELQALSPEAVFHWLRSRAPSDDKVVSFSTKKR